MLDNKLWYLIAAVIIGFGLVVGCQNDSSTSPAETEFFSGEFALFDFDDAMALIDDATLEQPMLMPELGGPGELLFGPDGPFAGDRDRRFGQPPHGPRGRHLAPILRDLNLSGEQREQVRVLMSDMRTCIEEPFAAFREAIEDRISEANQEREAILEALRNGEITRDEAREQLRALNEATREAIRNDPAAQEAHEALCACKLAHFDAIRALLTEEQQSQWDEWVANLDGPCFEGS